jgi:2,4-dienoyl-CoA reductase-like NADH-dependent reductase (Old Yellow Enzyme family)
MAFEELFQPIKIGPVEIKNRVAVAPMNGVGDRQGHLTNQYMCYFNARALGGFGLMTTGSLITNPTGHAEMLGLVPGIYPGALGNFSYYSQFTESIHSMGTGTKIFAQLSPGFGRQSPTHGAKGASPVSLNAKEMRSNYTKGQRAWSDYYIYDWAAMESSNVPREMTIDEIKTDTALFVQSAEIAVLCGFDGIEIHAPHGYLLHQFLSPRSNKRTDEYGGSLRNRARYLLEILAGLKANFGDAVPIVVRLSGREYQPDGSSAEDVRQICRWLEETGADAIDLSSGSGYDDMKHFEAEGDNIALLEAQGKKLKEAVKIPVMTPGLMTPEVAWRAVKEGETDIVSLGRQALADPEWPNKVKEGRIGEIARCLKDEYCNAMAFQGLRMFIRCVQNPNLGREEFMPEYWPKPSKPSVPETLKRWKPGLRWKSVLPPEERGDKE